MLWRELWCTVYANVIIIHFFRIGSLKPGDILLAVNDHTLVNKTPFDAVDMLKNSGDMVTLTVRREKLSTFGK